MKKRTGYIYKRGNVYWLRYKVGNGRKPIAQSLETTVKEDAEAKAAKIMEPIRATDEVKTLARHYERLRDVESAAADIAPVTLVNAWSSYLEQDAAHNPSDGLLKRYEGYWDEFQKHCQSYSIKSLREVTPAMAKDFMTKIKTQSAGTQKKKRTFMFHFFDAMQEAAKIYDNPFEAAKRKKIKGEVNSKRDLTIEMLKLVIDRAGGELKTAFIVGTFTGLRLGDCCRLRWEGVDLVAGLITTTPSKTESSQNKVVKVGIPAYLAHHLSLVKKRTGYVMPGMAEWYDRDPPSLSRTIQAHLESCGIKTVKEGTGPGTGKRAVTLYGFHSLRHSYITLLAQAGTPQAVLQKLVGHGSPIMTQLYTHLTDEAAISAAKALPMLGDPQDVIETADDDALAKVMKLAKGMNAKNWRDRKAEIIAAIEGVKLQVA